MKKLSIFIVAFLSVSIVATAQNNIPEITDTLEIDSAVWSDEYVDTPSNFRQRYNLIMNPLSKM